MYIPFTIPTSNGWSMDNALRRLQIPVSRVEYIRYFFAHSIYYDIIGDDRSAQVYAKLALVLAQRPSLYSNLSH